MQEQILAQRLGLTVHVSPLRFKLSRLQSSYPVSGSLYLEDWLVEIANSRGACVVTRPNGPDPAFAPPSEEMLSNEELVTAICQPQCLDRPQMLRLAAQLISRKTVDPVALSLGAKRERADIVLAELARQALRVEPNHETWRKLDERLKNAPKPREPILHWTRLAEPIMANGRCNAAGWRLAA